MHNIKILMLGEGLDRQGGIVSVEKLIIKHAPTDIAIDHISTLPNGSTIDKLLVFAKALGLLCWQLLKQEVDIVHIHVSERGSAFRQAMTTAIARLLRKPVILHAHSPDFPVFYARLPQIVKAGLRWSFCQSTRFIVLSDYWQKFYTDNLGLREKQSIVLPNPVKFPQSVPQRIDSQTVNFLFLGRIGKRKGAFDLIESFAAIPDDKKSQAQLIMAGDGEGEKAREIVRNLNLDRYVTILDWVDERKRDELLATANVFVLPSYHEGLPMALLEAMSWELPVIATPVGGIPELVIPHENGLLVNAGDVSNLSQAMLSLIDDRNAIARLGNNARNSVKLFDVETYMSSLSHIYRSLAKYNNKNQHN